MPLDVLVIGYAASSDRRTSLASWGRSSSAGAEVVDFFLDLGVSGSSVLERSIQVFCASLRLTNALAKPVAPKTIAGRRLRFLVHPPASDIFYLLSNIPLTTYDNQLPPTAPPFPLPLSLN